MLIECCCRFFTHDNRPFLPTYQCSFAQRNQQSNDGVMIDLKRIMIPDFSAILILRILGLYLKSTSAACICQTFLRLQVNQILKNHDQNQQLTIIFLQFISNMASHDCAFQDSFVEILNSRNYYLRRSARVIIAPTE